MKTSIRIAVVAALALSAIFGAPQAHHATQQRPAVAATNLELCC
jgi:hypothetical protein